MKTNILFTSVLLCILIAIPITAEETENKDLDLVIDAKSALLMEKDTGKILYDENIHETLPSASMKKIMTFLPMMEALDQDKLALNEAVRSSQHARAMSGSQIFLVFGE